MKDIRDSVHGYISITPKEVAVLDTPQVQRLRRVSQLGLSSLIYPGATHTRFEHSLGVLSVAGRIGEAVGLSDQEVRNLRLAGLLHDAGHGPFSHASERVAERSGLSHEELSCNRVEEVANQVSFDTDSVKKYIRGEEETRILNGAIDADKIDYLARDAYETGIEHGQNDSESVIMHATLDSEGKLAFKNVALTAMESILAARFSMHHSVYQHHTCLIAETMLERALIEYLENSSDTVQQMMKYDDMQMDARLRNADGRANDLYTRILNRDLFKGCFTDMSFVSSERQHLLENILAEAPDDEQTIERHIVDNTGVDTDNVIVSMPDEPSLMTFEMKVKTAAGMKDFEEVSPMAESLKQRAWRNVSLGVYTPAEHRDEVRASAVEYFESLTGRDFV